MQMSIKTVGMSLSMNNHRNKTIMKRRNFITVGLAFPSIAVVSGLSNSCITQPKTIENDKKKYKNILKYGIGFCGKECEVRKGE